MDWKEVGKKIANFAPLLGGIVGGPVGGAVGAGVKLLASEFGLTEEETTPEKIDKLLRTDPEAAIKLAQIEANNKIELSKLNLQQETIRLQDVANARNREIEITKATGKRDVNLYILAWTVIAGFFALCAVLMKVTLPEGSNEVVFMLFGALASGFGVVLQYFFGSSKSSSDKTKLLTDRNSLTGKEN